MGAWEHTNSDHKQFPRPDHVDHAVGVFEDLNHHLLLVLGSRPVLGVGTGMHNAVHVQVQIVELLAIGIRFCRVDGNSGAIIHNNRLVLDDGRYDLGVFGGEPPKGSRNTHRGGLSRTVSTRRFERGDGRD